MCRSSFILVLVALVSVLPRTAAGQTAEVGVGISGVHLGNGRDLWGGDGLHTVAIDVHANAPLAPRSRFSIEGFVTYGQRSIAVNGYGAVVSGGDTRRAEGAYGVAIKQRLVASTKPGFHAFVTYGLAGSYARERAPSREFRYPNGYVYRSPASTYEQTVGPGLITLGGGFEKELGRRLALRVDTQAMLFFFYPVGARVSAGVVVPFGR